MKCLINTYAAVNGGWYQTVETSSERVGLGKDTPV